VTFLTRWAYTITATVVVVAVAFVSTGAVR